MKSMITHVLAQAAAPAPMPSVGEQLAQMLPMFIMIIAIFYFVIYRPQKQQREKQQDMINQLKKGDKVVTSGGIYGTIVGLEGEAVQVRIADQVKVKIARSAITGIQPESKES